MYDESCELDENELKIIIEKSIVSDAITVHNLLTKKGIGIFFKYYSNILIFCTKIF